MRTGESRRIFCTVLCTVMMAVMALVIPAPRARSRPLGAITGVVTDPSGAPVAGAAMITVTDADRGTSLEHPDQYGRPLQFPAASHRPVFVARGSQRIPDIGARERRCWS